MAFTVSASAADTWDRHYKAQVIAQARYFKLTGKHLYHHAEK
ncbi:hypothetical protein VD0001_g7250 [Verticillium dahliae]|nr:hypothetical protein VD0001_g7250 [Verticillium dahliae]